MLRDATGDDFVWEMQKNRVIACGKQLAGKQTIEMIVICLSKSQENNIYCCQLRLNRGIIVIQNLD